MVNPITTKIDNFTNVVAGGVATANLPAVGTYYGLQIEYQRGSTPALATAAQVASDIEEIEILRNGVTMWKVSGAELIDINSANKQTFKTGFIDIFFAQPKRRSESGEDLTAWGMEDVRSFQVRIRIASGVANPSLVLRRNWLNINTPTGAIRKLRPYTVPVTGAGLVNFPTLPLVPGNAYSKLHCFSDKIVDVIVKADNETIFEHTKESADALYNSYDMPVESDVFLVAFDYRQRIADALTINKVQGGRIQQLSVDFNMAASPASFVMVAEQIGLPE